MARMIFTSLSPNAERDDALLALSLFARPWRWLGGNNAARLERLFRDWLPAKYVFAFESGRTGLYAILSTLGLKRDDEVLLQAYTCVAVPNSVIWAGARPVYVDVDEASFNMSPEDLERKITAKSRAIIIQHTFGNPADLDRLLAIAQRRNLFVIEDCAHALGANYKDRRVGTFGDAAFFSFGRDKVISSVFGGLVATNREDTAEVLRRLQAAYPLPGRGWVAQQLAHPLVLSFAKATYNWAHFGKLVLEAAKRLGIISKAVTAGEKMGEMPSFAGKRLPNALAAFALHQFEKLERFNQHRRKIAEIYGRLLQEGKTIGLPSVTPGGRHVFLRYTVRMTRADQIRAAAKKEGIYLGDWYNVPIAPPGVHHERVFYRLGSCPAAERLAGESLNLPTDIHTSEDDAKRVASFVASHL